MVVKIVTKPGASAPTFMKREKARLGIDIPMTNYAFLERQKRLYEESLEKMILGREPEEELLLLV